MIFRYLRITLTGLAILFPVIAMAQSPRKILVEEITNASVQSAYSQDSVFHWVYINEPATLRHVVPIIYHANYPGVDSFNLRNPDLHNGRVSFYGNDTPPMVRINGAIPSEGNPYPGAPGDTAAISRAIAGRRGQMSPVTISITHEIVGSQIEGTIKVSSTEALAGKRLYIVAMDYFMGYPNAGTHALPVYYFVPQQIYPDARGTELTLAANETKEFQVTFTPRQYMLDNSYFAAFVQDTATKEVLQAEHNIVIPSITPNKPERQIVQSIEPMEWEATLSSTEEMNYRVVLVTNLPDGWRLSVTEDGRELHTNDELLLKPGTDLPIKVKITPTTTSPNRKGLVYLILSGERGFSESRQFSLFSGPFETCLLVRDPNTSTIHLPIRASLDAIGGTYATIFEGEESLFDLSKHIMLVITGKQSLTKRDMAILRPAIDKGTKIFLSGAEVGYTLADPANADTVMPRDLAFLHDYLHADYLGDKSSSFTVAGRNGDPVGNGLSFAIDNGVETQDAPDVLAPRAGAETAFYYGTGSAEVAGIRYADAKNRLLFLGFGLEGIGEESQRTELMRKGIAWLRGSSGVAMERPTAAMMLGTPWPNPASRELTIPIHSERASTAGVIIYNSRGEEMTTIREASIDRGAGQLRIDCSSLLPGMYRVVVQTTDGVATAPVCIVR